MAKGDNFGWRDMIDSLNDTKAEFRAMLKEATEAIIQDAKARDDLYKKELVEVKRDLRDTKRMVLNHDDLIKKAMVYIGIFGVFISAGVTMLVNGFWGWVKEKLGV